MEKEDLEKSPLSFPRSSDQDEGFDNIHSYSVDRTDLCVRAAVNKNRRQAAQENLCFEENSTCSFVARPSSVRPVSARHGFERRSGLNFSRPLICNFFHSSLNSFLFRPQIKILFILFWRNLSLYTSQCVHNHVDRTQTPYLPRTRIPSVDCELPLVDV